MNATEARRLTNKNKNPNIQPTLDIIYRAIRAEAMKGKSNIYDPFCNIVNIDNEIREAVERRLRADGYKIVLHEGCDDGPNRSSDDYVVVSW